MTETDHPLKELIFSFKEAFVAWLLGGRPQQVRPLSIELPASARRGDLVFEVIQADGQEVVLHIELQGRRSHEPMSLRMLDYMSRLVQREELFDRGVPLDSVVLYVGQGAGRGDSGQYEVLGGDGRASLRWRYEVIRLWEVEAERLLELQEPALLALIGQTRMRQPERALSQAVTQIKTVADVQQQGRLLTALMSLLSSEEVIEMVEKMLDEADELLIDFPYLQRIRQQGKEEGLAEGKEEGLAEGLVAGVAKGKAVGKEEGLAEGMAKGREQGLIEGLREAILEIIALRFNPPAMDYRQISEQLVDLTDRKALQQVLATAIQADDMAAFAARLTKVLPDP